jgi:hypothetical protein
MNRKPGTTSRDLRTRAFGTAGRRDVANRTPAGSWEVVDLVDLILRRPCIPAAALKWKTRSGRVYDFPVRHVVEEK